MRRFERVDNLPIHAGVLLDTSASMEESLDKAQAAALKFIQETIQPKDRAVLIPFNDRPMIDGQAHQRSDGARRRPGRPQGRARHGALRQR